MWSTWTWKIIPVLFIILPMLICYSDPEAMYFCLFFTASAVYMYSFSKANVWLKLHNIYIDSQNLIIKKSVSSKPKYEISLDDAIKVEYQQFAQQTIGKFWYLEPQSSAKKFVYFWPTKREAKWDTSKLHQICVAADYKRYGI